MVYKKTLKMIVLILEFIRKYGPGPTHSSAHGYKSTPMNNSSLGSVRGNLLLDRSGARYVPVTY